MEYDTTPCTDGSFQAAEKTPEELRWEALLESVRRGGYTDSLGSFADRNNQLEVLRKEGPARLGASALANTVPFPRTEISQAANF